MTTPAPTAPAFDGTRRSMLDLGLQPFGDWWSTLPTGVQVALVLGFIAAMAAVIWWAIRHERRHTPRGTTSAMHKRPSLGRSSPPGS
ncbi:hypothetical protein [Kocuria rosea]|uniref:Uncharacterized protein n=1 Tax=Kocuria rosea TaxID=1275 RepID=A0A4R5YN57_KOCRO|nr:hypothetical protein [Kocuria rosea]TDL46508.1 hypothetical protein E2R59_00335 [Kocuria rosea]